MINTHYIDLITDLIMLREDPKYADKVDKALEVMEVEQWMINAIEVALTTGDE